MASPLLIQPTTDRSSGALLVVRELFEQLQEHGVTHCHWKSNEHLEVAVRGGTDLDVLVDRDAGLVLTQVLDAVGYKRITAVPARSYAGVEDFVALDRSTGRLAHLHLHYRLVLGEKNLKGYRVPWEPLVLATRRPDPATGIFVADPNVELILLIVRAALKIRHRDLLDWPWNRPGLSAGTMDEFLWLLARVNPERLESMARELLGADAAALLLRMTAGVPLLHDLQAFARAAAPVLRAHRTYRPLEAHRRRWAREWRTRWGTLTNRFLERSVPVKHTLPRGGLIIAFLGSDGSGKSTVTGEMAKWLAWKLDVRPIYFGSGDGPASAWRWPLRVVLALRASRRGQSHPKPVTPRPGSSESRAPDRLLRSIWHAWWSVAIAREKIDRLIQARHARNLGMVAICDRYPQSQIMSFNDGPRLSDWLQQKSGLLRALARWELAVYRSADLNPPDLVVKLHVTPEVAARRKPDMSNEELTRRVKAVKELRFPPTVDVVEVDATQSLDRVLMDVKRAIWERL